MKKFLPTRWCVLTCVALLLTLSGCANITAVNIPGIGYIDFDPPPVTPDDKHLMYLAVSDAASHLRVGTIATWQNPITGHHGSYEVTKVRGRSIPGQSISPYGNLSKPAVELTETISAGGREFITQGMAVSLEYDGVWRRYK